MEWVERAIAVKDKKEIYLMHAFGQLIKGSRSSKIGNDRTFGRGDNKEALNVVASDQHAADDQPGRCRSWR